MLAERVLPLLDFPFHRCCCTLNRAGVKIRYLHEIKVALSPGGCIAYS